MQIQGIITEICNTQLISDTFKKREFVVEYAENPHYPEFIKFEFIRDNTEILNNYNPGDEVMVDFNLKGRKWDSPQGEVKYFNTLQAWKITNLNASNGSGNTKGVQVSTGTGKPSTAANSQPQGQGGVAAVDAGTQGSPESEDLPF